MRHEPPPTNTPHGLPDTVQATIDAVRVELRQNRDALPYRTRDSNHDLHQRILADMETQEEHFLQYVETYGALGRIDDYLDMLAQAPATGNVIRTGLATTDPGTRTTQSGPGTSDGSSVTSAKAPPVPAPCKFTSRHWVALGVLVAIAAYALITR